MKHPSVTFNVELSGREHATVLAALRLYQQLLEKESRLIRDVEWIASDRGEPLTSDEVDQLCERIN